MEVIMNKSFWLITTEQLKGKLWFKDEEDYKVGMNYVAILSSTSPVSVLAFILMSNHVHFVVEGNYSEVYAFFGRFKSLYSQYSSHKYSDKELLRNNSVDIRPVSLTDESLLRAIAYVQMNSVAANICIQASGYPWGTGDAFFRVSPSAGKPLGSYRVLECRKMLHSKISLPKDYIVDNRGFVLPESYVQVKFVESVFRTPKRMMAFLLNSSKIKSHPDKNPKFSDMLLLSTLRELCQSAFGVKDFSNLDYNQKADALRILRYRFFSDSKQISRVTGLDIEVVDKLLDSFYLQDR